jgi:signal transduction histidine kinase/ActR/RegA family two-component response regulator
VIDHAQAVRDRRVLLLPPTPRDGATTCHMLAKAGIACDTVETMLTVVRELNRGTGVLLLPEEAIAGGEIELLRVLAAQPPWSDLPILVMTRPGADSAYAAHAVRVLSNVTLLERPLHVATLISAIRTALRARERQYQIRAHLTERARVVETLREADRRKDEFLATLGHELRNPLSPLLTSLHLLKRSGGSKLIVSRTVEVMERQVHFLMRLVDDLLEISRITRGVIDVTMQPLDLSAIVSAAIESSRPFVESGRHELTFNVPEEALIVQGDAVRLTQVFANLINNAAKYTDVGGHIWVDVQGQGSDAVVTVRDDGIGIAPEHLSSVFDMFTQVNRSDRRTQGGLGIGLTLVRSLIQVHRGSVVARSEGISLGTTFEVRLPIVLDRQPSQEEPGVLGTFPNCRVLVVDDNHDAGDMLGMLLTSLHATVRTVHSGPEALATIDEFDPDVILLDIGMPFMDGYEVARRIRARRGKSVRLIALTGWGQEEDVRRAERAGFDHHLVKPPDLEKLGKLLTQARVEGRHHVTGETAS